MTYQELEKQRKVLSRDCKEFPKNNGFISSELREKNGFIIF